MFEQKPTNKIRFYFRNYKKKADHIQFNPKFLVKAKLGVTNICLIRV